MFSVIALILAIYLYFSVKRQNIGNERMAFLADAIQSGAMAFLKREYIFLFGFVVIFTVTFFLLPYYNTAACIAFVIGSILPAVSGYVGMKAATISNARTTQAALSKGEKGAFQVAFRGGAIMGLTTTALALLGMNLIIRLAEGNIYVFIAFGFGAGLIGLFGRVGGGIYTKAADVGADLVGKIEAGIPEDDPRNPAVIADNVGDNVGDIAGMGADIFGSYINALIAAIVISLTVPNLEFDGMMYVFTIAMSGLFASLLTIIFLPRLGLKTGSVLRYAPITSSVITLIIMFIWNSNFTLASTAGAWFFPLAPFCVVLIGIIGGSLIGLVTEWYTAGRPVRKLAEASKAGPGSNMIHGLATGMESTIIPLIIVCVMITLSYMFMGNYGVAVAAVAMLSNLAVTMAIDAYGPIADNAGGIAEMAGLDSSVRDITDKLDAYGNTTAAMGKGFAIGAAILTTTALISAFITTLSSSFSVIALSDTFTLVGLFIGGMLTFFFSSTTMRAVGDTAIFMVEEVRRQFKEIPGLMEGTATPNYKACVDISTSAALKKMLLPGIVTILTPILAFFVFGDQNYKVLAGILVGTLLTGSFMALFMANAGGAWDNAKKYIEAGKLEGYKKGSEPHKAAVTGDTVGDPFKDTSGPSLNILIKLVATLALILLPFIV